MPQTQQNPFDRSEGQRGPPSSELDLYDKVVSPTAADSYLNRLNLGLGYYSDKEYWQQVESYKNGMYADAAFGRALFERAVREAKNGLGREAWEELDDDEKARKDRRRFVREKGEERWGGLPTDAADPNNDHSPDDLDQLGALERYAGLTEAYTPPFWTLLEMRHDASRSRGARLIDNVFQRIREFRGDGNQSKPQGFLKRGGDR